MARDKKAAQKQKPAKAAAGAAADKAAAKKGKKAKQGSYDSLRDPLDRCGWPNPFLAAWRVHYCHTTAGSSWSSSSHSSWSLD
jgi:hypothetical protein